MVIIGASRALIPSEVHDSLRHIGVCIVAQLRCDGREWDLVVIRFLQGLSGHV